MPLIKKNSFNKDGRDFLHKFKKAHLHITDLIEADILSEDELFDLMWAYCHEYWYHGEDFRRVK